MLSNENIMRVINVNYVCINSSKFSRNYFFNKERIYIYIYLTNISKYCHFNMCVCYLLSHVQLCCLGPVRLLCPWNSPGQNAGVGSHFLLQGIFPTQGSDLGLQLHRQILYCLSHQGSPFQYIINIKN